MADQKTGRDLLKQARGIAPDIQPEQLRSSIHSGEDFTLVDVREGEEFRAGHLPGAVHLPRGFLELQVDAKLPDKSKPVVIYCAGGNRSVLSVATLKELGYTDVRYLPGGYTQWRESGFEVEIPKQWSDDQRDRYSRHFVLPEVGQAGQQKISEGRVLVVGAGGLGSPALYYLGAAGVGNLGIVDFDAVEANNLQRQIIHATSRIGVNKAESAAQTIKDLNPDVELQTWQERITPSNVEQILDGFDLVIDATDNFATRYMLNEAAYKQDKAYIYGSIFRFEGYASVFWPKEGGPCYRCLHPEAPPDHLAPT